MSKQQHCRMLQVEQFFDKVECCFDKVESCFDIVAERNFVLSTKSKQIEHVQFVSTSSKGRNSTKNLVRRSYQKRQQCRSNVRLCRSNIRLCSIRQCCFDMVAGVDGVLDTMWNQRQRGWGHRAGPTRKIAPLGGAVARVFPNVSLAMCPLKLFLAPTS